MPTSTRYYVGVDGGGTSCRARICDNSDRLLGEAKTGSANILLGVEVAMASIQDAITNAAAQAGLSHVHYSHMRVGLALAGAEQKEAWYAFKQLSHPYASMTLNTDAYGACLGAWAGKDGAILIAGTGSCGILIADGQQRVFGGREFPISDQGGGAMMGLNLIQQVLLGTEGIVSFTPLAQAVMQTFSHDVDQVVSWSKTARPCDYGQFSPLVFEYAAKNDTLAIQVLKQTAAEVEMLLSALFRAGAKQVALMGSIGEHIVPWLSPPFQAHLVAAQGDAMAGALLMTKGNHNLY